MDNILQEAKIIRTTTTGQYNFWCPACKIAHSFKVPPWGFNDDMEKPTVDGSIYVMGVIDDKQGIRCHLFITDGIIEYCDDCSHNMKGKKVLMERF